MIASPVQQMSDADLASAVKSLIEDKEPESLRLDYKESLSIKGDVGKKELAKDVSSFANEQGGMLVYGVPETKDDDLPRPTALAECGMSIDPRLPEQIENILVATVQPPLHALTIRVLSIPEIAPKQLLVIHHPESYWKPHMVEGYNVGRYYRRGMYRAVLMNEREVEAAHLRRESARTHAREFLSTASFGDHTGTVLRVTACPVMQGRFKETMLQPNITDWLYSRSPGWEESCPEGHWVPFLDGWRSRARSTDDLSDTEYEMRLFHSGAVSFSIYADYMLVYDDILALDRLRELLSRLFLGFGGNILRSLGISGPLLLHLSLMSGRRLFCVRDYEERKAFMAAHDRIKRGSIGRFGGQDYNKVRDLEKVCESEGRIAFEEETSVEDVLDLPDKVLDRLILRMATAFGRWETGTGN